MAHSRATTPGTGIGCGRSRLVPQGYGTGQDLRPHMHSTTGSSSRLRWAANFGPSRWMAPFPRATWRTLPIWRISSVGSGPRRARRAPSRPQRWSRTPSLGRLAATRRGRRTRVQSGSGTRPRRNARTVRQQRFHDAHDCGPGRQLDHPFPGTRDVGHRDSRSAWHVSLSLHGASLGDWRDYGRSLRPRPQQTPAPPASQFPKAGLRCRCRCCGHLGDNSEHCCGGWILRARSSSAPPAACLDGPRFDQNP